MKHIFLLLSLFLGYSLAIHAQSKSKIITDTFTVSGNCSMCQSRIEEAAYIKGVKRADWDKSTHVLTVSYRPSQTSKSEIAKSITDAGHDAAGKAANADAYNKLPHCCAYRGGATCSH